MTPASQERLRELGLWIESELEFYVKDYINDTDYAFLRRHLIEIAEAHAHSCVLAFFTSQKRHG